MKTNVSLEDLEFFCESAHDLVLKLGNANDRNELAKIDHNTILTMIQTNDQYYNELPKEQLRGEILATIAESYDFSPNVNKGFKLLRERTNQ
jgi:hypothetical protein